jgi:hypothetical protein
MIILSESRNYASTLSPLPGSFGLVVQCGKVLEGTSNDHRDAVTTQPRRKFAGNNS